MHKIESTWLGLVTLGWVTLACTDDGPAADEVGAETETLGTETTTSAGESSESDDATESSTDTDTTEESTSDTSDTMEESSTDTDTTDTDTTETETETETTGDGDFTLIEAALIDDFATLVLTFSDEVAPVDAVDPTDFRISFAWTYSAMYEELYELSYYIDPNVFVDGNATPIGMVGIVNGPGLDQVSLMLAPVFDEFACAAPADYLANVSPGVLADAALFPHYSPGADPVTSMGGVDLAAIGAAFVLEPGDYTYIEAYHWPNLDPQVPIPCP